MTDATASRSTLRTASYLVLALIAAAAIFLRVWHLSWLPGVNGDEAWYGVAAERLLKGGGVTLTTKSGNPINPLFFIPVLAAHLVARPSFFVLRLAAVFYGLLTIGAGYWVANRLWGKRPAICMAILLACIPVDLAYSRFTWDPSMIVFIDLLFLFACARFNVLWMYVLFVVSLVVHPTNVLELPAGLVIAAAAALERRPSRLRTLLPVGLIPLALVFVKFNPGFHGEAASAATQGVDLLRLVRPRELLAHLQGFSRLLFGPTVYEYLVGPAAPAATFAANWVLGPLLFVGLLVALAASLKRRSYLLSGFIGGFLASLAASLPAAGPKIFDPGMERYGLFTLAPALLALVGIAAQFDFRGWAADLGKTVLVPAAGVAMLVSFYFSYFVPYLRTGGEAHRTFRTADPEPKLEVFEVLERQAQTSRTVAVFVDDWWLSVPLQYLDAQSGKFRFIQIDETPDITSMINDALARGDSLFVTYESSRFDRFLKRRFDLSRSAVPDRAGNALINVYGSRPMRMASPSR